MKRLPEQQIIRILTSPRAALDRLLANGSIDFSDLGHLQVSYVTCILIDKHSGIEQPDSTPMENLVAHIDEGLVIEEDEIVQAREWLDKYAAYLRRVPFKAIHKAQQELGALTFHANKP